MTIKARKNQPVIKNRRAAFRFELLDTFECGMALWGSEVQSLRRGQGSLEEAYAHMKEGEIWLRGMHIAPYEHGQVHSHEPTRARKLLLHKREIDKLGPKLKQRGLTLVPLKVYFNDRGLAKLTLALARGKTHRDKRQDMQKRDAKREMDRAMRRR